MSLKELTQAAMTLPTEERAFLAEKLLSTLDFEEEFPVSEAWLAEVKRRCEELDAGIAETIPAEEVFAQLRSECE
jgi:putative addiction module component (TIGR02574 family)